MNREEWLKERLNYVTASEASALFNFNPYMTRYELWHRKKDKIVEEVEMNERMAWGQTLEKEIGRVSMNKMGYVLKNIPTNFFKNKTDRISATVDFIGTSAKGDAIFECKNVDSLIYKNKWEENAAPPQIELQVQVQMYVAGVKKAFICVLVGGNKLEVIERELDNELIVTLKNKVAAFWKSIEENIEPPVDSEKDYKFIKDYVYSKSCDGKVMDITDPTFSEEARRHIQNTAESIECLQAEVKEREQKIAIHKANMLNAIGDNEKVIGDGFSVSAKRIPDKEIPETVKPAHTRKGYRRLVFYFKKEK